MNTKLPELTERQIQGQVIQYLRTKGFYVQRLNAGEYPLGEGRARRFVQGVAVGTPDVVAFKRYELLGTYLLFVEVKRPKNKPTPLQAMKMEELESFGARCLIIHSLEELEEQL